MAVAVDPDLAILIPAFNEAEALPRLVQEMLAGGYERRQILVINDCSADPTLAVAKSLGVATLDLPINLGIGGAVQAGYRWAFERGFAYAVQVDGDGQHDPATLAALLARARETGADMVVGSRFVDASGGFRSTFARRVGIWWFSSLIRLLTGRRVQDTTSGLRLVGRRLIGDFARDYPIDYPEPETLGRVLARSMRVEEMAAPMRERASGASSISPLRSVYYMIKVTLGVLLGCAAGLLERRRHEPGHDRHGG